MSVLKPIRGHPDDDPASAPPSEASAPPSTASPPVSWRIDEHLRHLNDAISQLPHDELDRFSESLFRAYRDDKQVFTLGNGGSSSTASHMAADLAKNTIGANMHRFRITCLSDNMAIITALGNDLGYENVFVEQLMNHIRAGDILVVISASGNSPNVLKAMRYARSRSAEVVGLLGFDGGVAAGLADNALIVPSHSYGVVEDAHLIINHVLVDYFKVRLTESRPWLV
jgi:D-sedoheptulose 7-phosphate isomerase